MKTLVRPRSLLAGSPALRLVTVLLASLLLLFMSPAPAANRSIRSRLPAAAAETAPPAQKKQKKASKKKAKPAGQAPAESKDQQKEQEDSGGVRLLWRNRPSLRIGNLLRVDLRVKLQTDFRFYNPDMETDEGMFDFHRKRVGLQGRFLKHFEYEIEREFTETRNPWRDVFVNFRYFDNFQIQGGKFKIPFGMDQLTGPTNLDFVYRSLLGDNIAPSRDLGIMAHGRFFKRGLSYQAGLFQEDGENDRNGERTFAGRVTGTPLRLLPSGIFRNLEIGGAFTSSTVPEGLKGPRGRTASRIRFFDPMFVHGQRLRLGAEMDWSPGPFSVKGEFMHLQDERRGQSIRGQNLPDLVARGWYLSGTWAVTGEKKEGGIEPRKNFLFGWGGRLGAVELAARYEQLRFGSAEHPGRPSRGIRVANILGNSDRVWTFGVNWYINRYAKIQFNGIREKIEDLQRAPIPGQPIFWIRIVRLQFVM